MVKKVKPAQEYPKKAAKKPLDGQEKTPKKTAKTKEAKEVKKTIKKAVKAKTTATVKVATPKKTVAKKTTVKKTVKKEAKLVTPKDEVISEAQLLDESFLADDDLSLDGKSKKNHPPTENNPNDVLARAVLEESLQEKVQKKALKPLTTQPTSMEELLAKTGYELRGLKKGQEVAAIVTDTSKRSIYFDVGAKTEGILLEKEMEFVNDYVSYLREGDVVLAMVVSPENEKGQILLSLNKTATEWRWKLFEKYLETGEMIEVRGLDINKGGMIARVLNVRGFIPVSQFGRQWIGKLDQLYNKVFPVKIIEVDQEKNRLIFSEKAVSESDVLNRQEKLLERVKSGDRYKGQISGVMPFGIFVRVLLDGGDEKEGAFLDGLVHISEISWEKVNDVQKMFKVGDVIDIQVIDADESTNKLNLSIKRLSEDPWEDIAKQFPPDAKTKGKVTRLAAFGAFVELSNGIEGLVHISKIPSDVDIKVGDELDVYIESIDVKNHRISLGLVLSTKPVGYK